MDTFVKKLRGASSNQNLPLYENVVLKNWIRKTIAEQNVDLSSKMSDMTLDNYEVSIDFMIPSDSLYLDSGMIILGLARAYQSLIYVDNNEVKVAFTSTNVVFSQEVSLDTLHTITVNTNTNKITLDGVEHSFTYTHSTSPIREYSLFHKPIRCCGVYLGEVKFKRGTSDNYEFILVPAIVNGISCYKNTLANSDYVYANTGELTAFNL